jgi:nucleoside-diphosphate-sugar epimerase
MMNKRILVLGAHSFAAKGLCALLESQGYSITTFKRGELGGDGNQVTGSVFDLVGNPFLKEYDIVVNYVLLKDLNIEENNKFIDSLLLFCENRNVHQLIHISSVSSYGAQVKKVVEYAPIETVPERKGSYGALKVATDLRLLKRTANQLKVTFVRPGFILGRGVVSPIIGMAFRFGKNVLFQIGSHKNVLPITTREILNQVILRLCAIEQVKPNKVILVVDSKSPTRYEWLCECCTAMGVGTRVLSFPVWLWKLAGISGELVFRILRSKIHPWTIVQNACREMTFNPRESESYLSMDFGCDWKNELKNSFENQSANSVNVYPELDHLSLAGLKKCTFIGYGGIVKQRHLDALNKIAYSGEIEAFDLNAREDNGQSVQAICDFRGGRSDLTIIATPGVIHADAIELVKKVDGPIVVEKPLCYSRNEYALWKAFAQSRNAHVMVCHNYRFKENMLKFYNHLNSYNPGKLLNVHLDFQSPPVSMDSAGWRKQERKARTLLMDYALHFLDIACMFNTEKWSVKSHKYELNSNGETALIGGLLSSEDYDVSFMLRQGFQPRRCRLFFTFQNYGISVAFFPDTFVPYMTDDSAGVYQMESKQVSRAIIKKVIDKMANKNSDASHAYIFGLAGKQDMLGKDVTVEKLEAFYQCIFDLGDLVYGK